MSNTIADDPSQEIDTKTIMTGFPPPRHLRPGPTDWDLAPFNRWSFRHMRQMVPTIEVRRGLETSTMLADEADLSAISFVDETGETLTFQSFLAKTYTDGLLVYWRGKVRAEIYCDGMKPHDLHLSQSVAKSVVGTLVGILAARGEIDPGRLASDYVPELLGSGYRGATVQHMLDMRSGIHFSEDYNAPDSEMTRIDRATMWRPPLPGSDYEGIFDIIQSLVQDKPHGGAFDYRSVETDAVGWVVERAMQAPLAELVSEHIWQKMGAERDACFTVDKAGTALADGGFNATLRDYARFGRLILEAGTKNDPGIVPLSYVTDTQSADPSVFGAPYNAVLPGGAYRNFWWIRNHQRKDLVARGVFGQMIYVDRASDLMVVKLSTWPTYLSPEFSRTTLTAIDAIRAHLEQNG